MKVLEINSVCGIRSTGRICEGIARSLIAQGDDCRVAYGREDAPARCADFSVRIASKKDVYAHALLARATDGMGLYSRGATQKFIAWAQAFDPDVIHLHNLHGYYLHLETLFRYLARAGKPVVWTLHDCWAFTGHCPFFTAAGCAKWKTGCGNCPVKDAYPARLLADRSARNYCLKRALFTSVADMTLAAPSRWLCDLTRASFLSGYPVRLLPNGIDLSVFRPSNSDFRARHSLAGKIVVLGVAAVWDARKGLQDFFRLAEMLDDRFRFVLVGLNEKQLAALPPRFIGLARTNSAAELAQIYTAADVLFNPTYEDNYPTVNLEAQACGTDVLTYDTGGSLECLHIAPRRKIQTGDVREAARLLAEHGPWEKLRLTPDALRELDENAAVAPYIALLRERAGARGLRMKG